MEVRNHLLFLLLFSFSLIAGLSGAPVLSRSEVRVLKEIAKRTGLKDWDFGVDPCSGEGSWSILDGKISSGIECDCHFASNSSCHITRLFLKGQNISGELPAEFGKLLYLQQLDLSRNVFNGSIPATWSTMHLLDLELMGNRLSGQFPEALTRMSTLKNLSIEGNRFSGPIPPEIGNLVNLERLSIESNQFSGVLPADLAKLTNLIDLRISDNMFSGKVPNFISHLARLEKLHIQGSFLDGPIPPGFSNLINLVDMRITDLGGNWSAFPQVKGMKSLKTLILRNCSIHGTIPPYLGNMGSLKNLDLSFNKLTGEIPSTFANLKKVDFMYLTGNVLTGTIPNWALIRNKNLDISSNNFSIGKSGPTQCPQGSVNLVESYAAEVEKIVFKVIVTLALPSFLELQSSHAYEGTSLVILHHDEKKVVNGTKYEADMEERGASMLYFGQNWAFSSTGNFMDNNEDSDNYIARNTSILSMPNAELYTEARLSPLSLTYYGLCMGTGQYTREAVLEDFNIVEAAHFDPPSDPSGLKKSIEVIIGISAFFFVVLLVLGIWCRKRCIRQNSMYKDLRDHDLPTGLFTLRQVKAATANFDPANKIGEGGFGPVYKGLLSDGTTIAVKQLSAKSRQGNREFLNEIGMISALQHPNLVKLHGCCTEGNQLLLIYEYMENNCLSRALFGSDHQSRISLDWPTRYMICLDIARGLAYLHEESRLKIVHRDIKASNVLLDKCLNAKISDFGLAKLYEEDKTHISTKVAGTVGYMAPEYAMRGHLSHKADVYSFGVVALEIVTGKSNTSYRPKEEFVYLLDWACVLQEKGNLLELVDNNIGSEYSEDEAKLLLNVALLCTNASPSLRPAMSKVVSLLEHRTPIQPMLALMTLSDNNSTMFNGIRRNFWEGPRESQTMSSDATFIESSASISLQKYGEEYQLCGQNHSSTNQ
ncbi:hypothetical protein HPP92_022978 [Vanilla planifolia]|uniref:non-specific serine/threonine protein kinase n=1 Tax=Vanilla planifolia TaxID=51239 RepID=A0A835PPH9_VANPL|nr:hypothetical protein HPP92_022978 [Vanilla planifolia]